MRKARNDLPPYFMGEVVRMSEVEIDSDVPVDSIDGGNKYVVGIFPTFVQHNNASFCIITAETKQLYRRTNFVHPKNDGHCARAVHFITGSSREWLVMNAIDFLSPYVGEE